MLVCLCEAEAPTASFLADGVDVIERAVNNCSSIKSLWTVIRLGGRTQFDSGCCRQISLLLAVLLHAYLLRTFGCSPENVRQSLSGLVQILRDPGFRHETE